MRLGAAAEEGPAVAAESSACRRGNTGDLSPILDRRQLFFSFAFVPDLLCLSGFLEGTSRRSSANELYYEQCPLFFLLLSVFV